MSISGISSGMSSSDMQTQLQQILKDFKQLGQDLKSGNLSAAQSDFVTQQKDAPQLSSTSSTSQSTSPIAQAFSQLSSDLQAGNLSAAQQDFSTIQQDIQRQVSQVHHHHHSGGGQESQIAQMFQQLGQALQSGDMTGAQQAFSSLQQLMQGNSPLTTSGESTPSGLSVSA